MHIGGKVLIGLWVTAGFSCSEPEPAPEVDAKFTAILQGEAPTATLTIQNNSVGATTYLWSFEGTEQQTSTEESPGPIPIEQAGIITIVLEAGNGLQANRADTSITVNGFSPINFYQNVRLRTTDNVELPRYYSAELNLTYGDDEVSGENGPLVDLVLVGISPAEAYFASPDNQELDFSINQPSTTIIDNTLSNNEFDLADFDATVNASSLDTLTINSEAGSLNLLELPQLIIFQTDDGYKGALKITGYNEAEGFIEAEVKIQKYL
jgi:hypothetical protein